MKCEVCGQKAVAQIRNMVEIEPTSDKMLIWREWKPGKIHIFCNRHEKQWNAKEK